MNVQIADRAAVIDRAGLPGLTMRAVAKQLGMSTMALYRYVDDRDELELLLVEQMFTQLDTSLPADPGWINKIKTMVDRVRRTAGAHPGAVPLLLAHRHRSVSTLRWSETVLAILTESGFDGARRVIALRALLSYVIGAIQLEHLGPLSGAGTVTIAALPRAEFPLIAATARQAAEIGPDEEFTGGLELLLRGLATAPAGPVPGGPASP